MDITIRQFVEDRVEQFRSELADELARRVPEGKRLDVLVEVSVIEAAAVSVKASQECGTRRYEWALSERQQVVAGEVTMTVMDQALELVRTNAGHVLLTRWRANGNEFLSFHEIEQLTRFHPPSVVAQTNSALRIAGLLITIKADRHGGMAKDKRYRLRCVAPPLKR